MTSHVKIVKPVNYGPKMLGENNFFGLELNKMKDKIEMEENKIKYVNKNNWKLN